MRTRNTAEALSFTKMETVMMDIGLQACLRVKVV